ncbi:hypothetical protein [Intestinibacter bartlettii]|uniref:N-acetyltransferase domain-containing protein n=1 Tax=Intestinibacter bartlettii TaxID=261299 RepID=A0ABS6DWL3_9FIRM|nr:hypothetical protein [Intestinibacter bartlettii]MBU5336125.1 hypothetical protein [Intestinibacter bartlettii]
MIENRNYEENILEELCKILNQIIFEVLQFEPCFAYHSIEGENYYTIHNKIKSYGEKRFDLNMRVYKNENEKGFLYVYMLWFSVNPKKRGLGSIIVNEILELLKALTDIKFVILHPDDNEVKYFWVKNKFMPSNGEIDKKIDVNTRRILVYAV